MRPRRWTVLALCVAMAPFCGCRVGGADEPAPLPPRGAIDLPPKEPPADAKPAEPQACKHAWEAARQLMHSYTVFEDEIPIVKLCTPLVCTKCGALRHECLKELRRRAR